jgi:hypothetical protein
MFSLDAYKPNSEPEETAIGRQRYGKHSRGNGFARNNRGAAGNGLFYAVRATHFLFLSPTNQSVGG